MIQDIAVIGASTTGLYAAELLAISGKNVTLYERSSVLSPQERTYIITPSIKQVIPDLDPALIRHRVDRISLEAGKTEAEIKLSSPDLILDRRELISELARRAENAGVDIKLGCVFKGLSSSGDPELIFGSGQEQFSSRADWLIGADGAKSAVRKSIGKELLQTVPLLQAQVNLPDNFDNGITKVWFRAEKTPFFFWLIPDRNNKGVVGLIAETETDIRDLLDSFLEEQGFKVNSYQSGVASLHQRGLLNHFRFGNLPVSLIGDAAGQVKVTTVGGTVTGLAGARATAEGILSGTILSRTHFALERELNLHLFIRKLLQRMAPRDYINLVESINPAVKSFLSARDRDSMRAHFWKLPFLQPKFIPLGLRLLLRL